MLLFQGGPEYLTRQIVVHDTILAGRCGVAWCGVVRFCLRCCGALYSESESPRTLWGHFCTARAQRP